MGSSSLNAIAGSKAAEAGRPRAQAPRSPLLQSLMESVRCETGGEVIVRSGERTGRLFFFRGRVAWVTASSLRSRLTEHLAGKGLASPSDMAAVFSECRRQGGNFAEMLVDWGLIDRDRMRAEILEYISRAFGHIVEWGAAATIFVPSSREYKSSLTYSLAELVEATKALAPEQSESLQALIEAIEPHSGRPAEAPKVLDEGIRASVVDQLKQLRSAADCLGSCFVGDGVRCCDLGEAAPREMDSPSSAGAMLREASEATTKIGFGACSEMTLVGSNTAMMAWLVTCPGAGRGVLMVLLGRDAPAALARIVVERALADGPLRRVPPETAS